MSLSLINNSNEPVSKENRHLNFGGFLQLKLGASFLFFIIILSLAFLQNFMWSAPFFHFSSDL